MRLKYRRQCLYSVDHFRLVNLFTLVERILPDLRSVVDSQHFHGHGEMSIEHIPGIIFLDSLNHSLDPVRLISNIPKPVIARCNGDVVGGGLGLAMACEFRIAGESTRFCAPFVKIGLAGCDMSAGYFLPRLIGLSKATDMMMTGRFVGAEEADRIGLTSQVVADGQLDAAVAELAGNLAAGAPRALAFTKQAIRRSLERGMEEEFDYEIFAQVQCLQSEDHMEGVKAFMERRPAKFAGR